MKKIYCAIACVSLFTLMYTNFSYADKFDVIDNFINEYRLNKKINNIINTEKINTSDININTNSVVLGDDMLFTDAYKSLIKGKNIGVIANQTSINSKGENIKDVLYKYKDAKLTSLYAPEHGIDGKIKAGQYIKSYIDSSTKLPIYSLYAQTREPSKDMMSNIDVMIFDLQDIGSRTYTYISTMYKSMEACKKYGKTFIVLDRPNPISCKYVEGFVLSDEAKSFVGIDNMPMAHGMTAGELAKYFNRNIGVDLKVVPMKNYNRNMIWQDTGLKFQQTSPYIPNIESAFGYMATGQSENMGIGMGDSFTWSGGTGINSKILADKLNGYNLEGVNFIPQNKGDKGGVKVQITDYHKFNPAKTGYYVMATANEQKRLTTPLYEANGKPSMFYKISGNKEFAEAIKAGKSAQEIENLYKKQAENFRKETKKYYIYK